MSDAGQGAPVAAQGSAEPDPARLREAERATMASATAGAVLAERAAVGLAAAAERRR